MCNVLTEAPGSSNFPEEAEPWATVNNTDVELEHGARQTFQSQNRPSCHNLSWLLNLFLLHHLLLLLESQLLAGADQALVARRPFLRFAAVPSAISSHPTSSCSIASGILCTSSYLAQASTVAYATSHTRLLR